MIWETVLGAFLQVLFDRLATRQIWDFFGDDDFDQTLFDKLKTVLLTVSAVLSDAEEKQITNPAVKGWLNELQDAVYHADDLLDEINTIALRFEVNWRQVPDQFSTQAHDKNIESRLKKIVERLESLAKEKDLLNLKETVGQKPPLMFPTTSLVDESEVFGRDKDKEELIKILIEGNIQENRIPVIAMVGTGGIGKTTLAQILYNDTRVKHHFNLRVWAHVSQEFDVSKVSRIIFESVISSRNCNDVALNLLQVRLKERLTGKKFLLVLDDIWNENFIAWEMLLGPLKAGACGSRIIVTTRNRNVASLLRPLVIYPLLHLSDKDCWSLFAKHAFCTSNPEEHPTLNGIGWEIVKKCKGLPLVAKTLGGLLHPEVEAEEWRTILNSKIWDLPNDKSSILPALLLSYYHLPSHLKRCFAYCSIIPNGRVFEKEKLILMWMAEDLLQKPNGEDTMNEVGEEYFSELVSRSFFQPRHVHGKRCFVMHDLMMDLAQFVSGEFCCKFEDNKPSRVSEKARHLVCSMDRLNGPEKFLELQELKCLRSFLPLSSNPSQCSALSNMVSDLWMQIMKQLRVLSFSDHAITELPDVLGQLIHLRYLDLSHTLIRELPNSTCSLYNLQTLLLSRCHRLTVLPENIGELTNLRHLDVTETNLREMSPEFGRLKSLQVLTDFVVGRDSGSKISELGNLSNLRKLSISRLQNVVNAMDATAANLRNKKYINELVLKWTSDTHDEENELSVLDKLQPHDTNLKKLTIDNYGGIRFPDWLGNAFFSNMVSLCLSKCKNCTSLPPLGHLSSLQELYIAKMEKLQKLGSEFYGNGHLGVKPFRCLKTLQFEDLPSWTHWEPFPYETEEFPALQELQIQRCPKLIGSLPKHLRSLTKLVVSGCQKLQASVQRVPTLKEMMLHGLDDLTTLPEELLAGNSCFQKLEIVNCPSLSSFPRGASLSSVKSISILHCKNLKFFLPENTMQTFGVLKRLQIVNSCDSLESLSLGLFTKLQYLHIEECRIKSLLMSEQHGLDLKFLREMKIKDCPNLESFPVGGLPTPKLQSLSTTNCNNLMLQKEWGLHKMVFLTCFEIEGGCSNVMLFPEEGLLPRTLTTLRIGRLPNLKFLNKCFQDLTSLETLKINCCEKLELFPEEGILPNTLTFLGISGLPKLKSLGKGLQDLTSLKKLEINFCEKLELFPEEGILPNTLTFLGISGLPNLKSLGKGLQYLTSLEKLEINCCEKLDSMQVEGLPASISSLHIQNCSLLAQLCQKGGVDWHKISHIADVYIFPNDDRVVT